MRQGEVGIRAPIGEDQAQFLRHHRRERACHGSDGGRIEGQIALVRVGREMEDTSIWTDSGEGRRAPR